MKTLTVKQPWAHWIIKGIKDVENRSWKTNYRGTVLIHASKSTRLDRMPLDIVHTKPQLQRLLTDYTEYALVERLGPFGAIIGSVEIIDCVKGHTSIWAEKDAWNWVLRNAKRFPEPITTKGSLGLWNYPNILAEPEDIGGELFCHCHLPVDERIQVSGLNGLYYCRYCGGRWYK